MTMRNLLNRSATGPRGRLPLTVFLALGLAACGGGSGDNGDNAIDVSADPPAIAAERAARPGEVVLMQVGDDIDARDAESYTWTQVDGPPVRIGDPHRRHAHFLMPPVDIDVELTFVVDVRKHDGRIESEMHTIACDSEPGETDPTEPAVTGEYAVFRADKDIDNRVDLYLAMLDGSATYRLNGNLAPGGDVDQFRISPDRQHVAYLADQRFDGRFELFVAAADGSGATRVSPDLETGGLINDYRWSSDGSMIAIQTSRGGGARMELFTNTVDGDQLTRVSGDLVENGDVLIFRWSPVAPLIAYIADQYTDDVVELFVSSADGAENIRASELFDVDQNVSGGFRWSPDGSALAYAIFDSSENSAEIYVVDSDGANRRRVSHPRTLADEFLNSSIFWSPDGSRIAYKGRFFFVDSSSSTTTNIENLFTVAPDGSGATEVSAIPLVFGEIRTIFNILWAPDSSRIAYLAAQDTENVFELYTSGPDGGLNTRVSGVLVADGDVRSVGIAWAPDSSLLAYRADQDTDNAIELYVADPLGAFSLKVSGALPENGNVNNVRWSPDSSWLAYQADQRFDNQAELFSARPDGSANLRVSGQLAADGDVQGFAWASDGSRLVYRANQLDADLFELFVAAPDGGVVNANLSGPLTVDGDVFNFATQ